MFTAITERKALESALARTSAQLQEAQRIAHVGNWERDLETDALTWSDEMYRIYGLPLQPGTVTKNNCSSTIHPEDRPATAQAFEAAIQFGATLDLTHRVVMPTGEIRTVQVRGEVLVDSAGIPSRVTGSAQDVTLQVRQAESLRRKEQHLRSVFAAMSEGLVVHARDGHVIDANPAAEMILGLSRDQLLGRTSVDPHWHAIREDGKPFPGEEHPAMVTLRTGETVRNQVMGVLAPDTGLRWISVNSSPLFGADRENPSAAVATFLDITERKHLTTLFHGLFNQSTFLGAILDPECRVLEVNEAALRYAGTGREQLIGMHFADTPWWKHEPDRVRLLQALTDAQAGNPSSFEATHSPPQGSRIFVSVTTMPIRLENRISVAVFGVDITDRKVAERALRESETRFRTLADSAPVMIWMSDTESRCTWVNKVWLTFSGRTMEMELGHRWMNLIHPEDLPRQREIALAAVAQRQPFVAEFRMRRADGEYRWITSNAVPRHDESGEFLGYIGSCLDITQRHLNEEQVKQLAFYDALTRLPSRRLLTDRLSLAMATSRRTTRHGALMLLDLDNFKPLNDKFGHHVGDLLLVEVANRLRANIRQVDTAARFGGDEFVIILSGLATSHGESSQLAARIAEKIRTALEAPYVIGVEDVSPGMTVTHTCTASIGVALFTGNEENQVELFNLADAAMYRAKEDGRNVVRFCDADATQR